MKNPSVTRVGSKIGNAHRVELHQRVDGEQTSRLERREVMGLSPNLRALFSGPLMVTASADWHAVSIYALEWWEQLLPSIWRLPKEIDEARLFMSRFLGYAHRIEADGEFVLPPSVIAYAGLQSGGVLIEFDKNHAEIWSDYQLEKMSFGAEFEFH